uniref:WIF domain-containing protein n=1 Tax=Macrostomum lignano TaxID=282301 RepID=A0A1I8GZJ5_9PLAT
MSGPLRLSLLLLLAAVACSGELNVWFERQMLESVISQMMLLSAKNPLRPPLQAERFPIVADGHLLSGIYFNSLSRSGIVLANSINSFTVHWATASRDGLPPTRVQYKFMGLQSHNQSVLLHPRLTVPSTGFVPAAESSFQLNLQCTKRVSGVAEFEIHAVFQFSDRPEKRSLTMQHRFRKACLSAADLLKLQQKCYCRKKCKQQIKKKRRRRNHRKRQRAANSSPSRRRSDRRQQRRRRGDRRRGGKKGRNSRQRRREAAATLGRGGGELRRRRSARRSADGSCRAQPSDCQQRG